LRSPVATLEVDLAPAPRETAAEEGAEAVRTVGRGVPGVPASGRLRGLLRSPEATLEAGGEALDPG
jgi:hypothetical protein